MSNELVKWEPGAFNAGTDLLPVQGVQQVGPADIEVIEEEDLEPEDMILPQMKVLQGTTKEVGDEIEGAVPGKLFFTGASQVIVPPARVVVVHRFRGNAMFVRAKKPEYEGLEDCISRDGVTGLKYGDCSSCGRCTEWRDGPDGPASLPPLGSKTQQFVLWINGGLCILRVALSNKWATRYTRQFMTRRQTSGRNWFAHPTILEIAKETNEEGQTYFVPRMHWQESEIVPDDVQHACMKWYRAVTQALEHGTLGEEDPQPGTAEPDSATSEGKSTDIPF